MLAVYYCLAAERLGLTPMLEGKAAKRLDLTPRQLECLKWVCAGKSAWVIGEILNLSEHTVNEYLEDPRRRLGVRTTTQAAVTAVLRRLIPNISGVAAKPGILENLASAGCVLGTGRISGARAVFLVDRTPVIRPPDS
jgi:DNA-binding CsgD family transcriptional regulator